MFKNCYTYNDPTEDVVKMGKELEKIYFGKLARIPKYENEMTSARGKASKKPIGPQTAATSAVHVAASSSGIRASLSASSSVGSCFPVTPTMPTTNGAVPQRASVFSLF
ncbi:hypothetical protein DAPPUDRAFT_274818 [Daphnia pulex]|uniref:Bromo domain-containing protein n=1 Tax=Daphnia pulex TaxID=6669 RepID=E9I4S2_DAPPU|nr:hypothetical protein DAPPUDRAFT_274818 [Daphnia pulex]|eukprot:EFX61008.1 hypothetical protein DAPPUDRAFT_274818 [Daphnia pulex]